VGQEDLAKYEVFKRKFDPSFAKKQQNKSGVNIDWGDNGGGSKIEEEVEDSDDDLYN